MRRWFRARAAIVGVVAVAAVLPVAARQAAALADLVPTRIGVKLPAQGGGCEADVQATIRSIGAVDTAGYDILFTAAGQTAVVRAPNGTNAGGRSAESTVFLVAPGRYTVTVTADSANEVQESNGTNNTLSSSFTRR